MPYRILLPTSAVLLLFVFNQSAQSAGMKPVATVPLPCESHLQMISPAGDQVAVRCSDRTLRLISVSAGTTQHTFGPEPRITAYNYSRDGRWFAAGFSDGSIETLRASGTGEVKHWQSDTRSIDTLEFLPDSNGIVVGASDRPGKIWDLRGTPKQIATLHSDFAGLLACSFSPDGKLLITADGDTVIRFYNTSTWQLLHEYRGLTLETFAVAFTTDGKRAMIGGPDDRITLLDSATGAEVQKLPKDADVIRGIMPFGGDDQAVILYVDGDGVKPPHQSIWNVTTAKSVPLAAERPVRGGGIVRGQLWVSSANGSILDIWVYE